MLKMPTVSVNPAPVSRMPPATVTVAPFARRSLAPKVKLPLLMFTAVEAEVPFNVVVPDVTVTVPAPRFAFTVPPCRA